MPAYNPPPQVLISPVSNYYKGKAIRQGLESNALDNETKTLQNELLQEEVDVAPSKRKAAQQAALLQEENIRSQIEKRTREGEIDELETNAKLLTPILQDYSAEEDEDVAVEKFNAGLSAALENMSEKSRERYIKAAGPDHVFDHNEIMLTGLGVRAFMDTQKPTAHQKHIDALVDSGAISRDQGNEMLKNIEIKAGTVTGTTEFDPSNDPRTGSQKGADYQVKLESYETSSDIQEMISNTLPTVIEIPDAVGVKGAIAQGGAGLLSTLGMEEMGDAFAQYMSGASPEDIASIQTQLQALRGRIIPLVTGEEGKRLSEMEREIASRAVGLIEGIKGPADLTKAYPQVVGSMRQLYEESWAEKYRIAKQNDNFDYPYDLNNREQVVELVSEFINAGVDEKSIRRAVTRLKAIQGE